MADLPPLRALITDAMVIVVSILLAFTVDAWWQNRGDIELERQYLTGLLAELGDSRLELDSDLAAREQLQETLDRLIKSTDGLRYSSLKAAAADLGRARSTRQFAPVRSVFDDLVSSGRMRLIRSESIRKGLLTYSQALDKNELTEEAAREFVHNRFMPYLANLVPLDAISTGSVVQDRPGSLTFEGAGTGGARALSREAFDALSRDDVFRNYLIERKDGIALVLGRNRVVYVLIEGLQSLIQEELRNS